jgi:uncharacterized membrane protein
VKARLRIEEVIEGVLTTGLAVSGLLFVFGLALGTERLLAWGLVILMLTPVARVVILTASLLRERDFLFGFVSLFVLVVLVSGIVVSSRLGPGTGGRSPTPPAAAP